MIITEYSIKSIVETIPAVVLNPTVTLTPRFHWGDEKELNRYIQMKKEDSYPLIWLLPSPDIYIGGRLQFVSKECSFVIATRETRTDLFNDQRYTKTFEHVLNPLVNLLKPFGLCDYVNLQINSLVTLSDSGTISEESSILNFPALNIRETHERPEAMEEGSVMMVGYNIERIIQAMNCLKSQGRDQNRTLRLVPDYSIPNVSEKVIRIIISYIDYINRVVWSKNI